MGVVVQWTADTQSRFVEDMGVNHCRRDIFVPEQFVDGPDIVAGFEQMCGKAVAKSVAA